MIPGLYSCIIIVLSSLARSTPTANPPSGGSPLVSILAILGAVVGIIIVLTIAAVLVAIIRYPEKVKSFFTCGRRGSKSSEATDSVGIVRYTDIAQDEQTEDE